MVMTKKDRKRLAGILDRMERAQRFINRIDIVVARVDSKATTTRHFTRPGDTDALYPIAKDIGSELQLLDLAIREMRGFLEPALTEPVEEKCPVVETRRYRSPGSRHIRTVEERAERASDEAGRAGEYENDPTRCTGTTAAGTPCVRDKHTEGECRDYGAGERWRQREAPPRVHPPRDNY